MGYQESILTCYNKRDFKKLCTRLNSSKKHLEDWVEVYAIGRFDKDMKLSCPFTSESMGVISAGTYFVWWGGERHPFQSGLFRTREEARIFNTNNSSWECVFIEYVFLRDKSGPLENLDFEKKAILQHNDYMRLFEIPDEEIIKEEYIEQLENDNHQIITKEVVK